MERTRSNTCALGKAHKIEKINIFKIQKGFTIIEVLVSLFILVLIGTVVATFQRDVFYLSSISTASLNSAQDTSSIVRTMTKELRTMSIANNGSYPIVSVGTSTITFFSDTDGDGLKEKVRYYMSGKQLLRGKVVPTGSPLGYTGSETSSILINDVRNATNTPIFDYYDKNYTGTTSPMVYPVTITGVRLIKITVDVDADPNRSPLRKTYTSQVTLRNLKDNL